MIPLGAQGGEMIASSIVAVVVGFAIGWFVNSFLGKNSLNSAKKQSETLLTDAMKDAESLKKEKLIEVEDEIYKTRHKLEAEAKQKKEQFKLLENDLANKENNLDRKADLIAKKEKTIHFQQKENTAKESQLKIKQEKISKLLDEQNHKLEMISGLTREEAKQFLLDNMIDSAKTEATAQVYKILEDAKSDARLKAKDVILSAIQQTAADHAVESTVAIVNLPADDMKGRIIGREGRNIRAFEIVTGIDVIVDDTPEAVILSGYDPLRRELARITMEKLVGDGRIHPGRIEETYEKIKHEMDDHFVELGEQAAAETSVHGLNSGVIRSLGKLRFKISYGQNVLQHSKEVSMIAGLMAAELDLDDSLARRAGLLHDIGRALENRHQGGHAQAGYDYMKKNGENAVVLNAILAHHYRTEPNSPISVLIQVANEISKTRPGARREVVEKFISRMTDMEKVAVEHDGVLNAYAIQAGKEVRVIVDHHKIDDAKSAMLASDIAQKIQQEIDYPGQIKVITIREFRAIDFA